MSQDILDREVIYITTDKEHSTVIPVKNTADIAHQSSSIKRAVAAL